MCKCCNGGPFVLQWKCCLFFCEESMERKLIEKSSCVSVAEEYSNSQPVAEPRAIPEERQRGTVISASSESDGGRNQSGLLQQPCPFYRTHVLYIKKDSHFIISCENVPSQYRSPTFHNISIFRKLSKRTDKIFNIYLPDFQTNRRSEGVSKIV